MDFKQLIAKYIAGNLTISQIPQIAYWALETGYDSPSLCILAGLEGENAFVIQQYLNAALYELSIEMPSKRKAAIEYAKALAEEIIEGKRELISGVYEIIYRAISYFDFYAETKNFVYDSILFERVYGAFHEYRDFEACHDWEKDKEEVVNELSVLKMNLMKELQKWNEIIQSYLTTIN
ncbi:hypothetical protein BEL04_18430 [Mucilaginibacter sp. PPCGB 2223]|uniref:hypothetical protein n=1 Tax=Mucilaginibacter sp. PPCGB 2223 TaxID=1886027 RepID=UPI0008246C48|nr:hypothetical protein [Mucilaginibacter sp. PPCGB 2223]OCX50717.1 hypothetical protein BEL04_18430 [Mucilaginibacter sp. PPCGB 2223]